MKKLFIYFLLQDIRKIMDNFNQTYLHKKESLFI